MSEKKSKLHQLLAVEGSLKGTAIAILREASKVFKNNNHYSGLVKTYTPLDDDDRETFPSEEKRLVDTVPSKLDYIKDAVIKDIDCMYQKESTNTIAKSDLIVDGVVVATDVPSLVLLSLESKLTSLRDVYKSVPTLDPLYKWHEDEQDEFVWATDAIKTNRTKKTPVAFEKSPATKEHKAQVEVVHEDRTVGTWDSVHKSGCLSPKQKSVLLEKIDNLIRCVKIARCGANNAEANTDTIGKKLFDYINR